MLARRTSITSALGGEESFAAWRSLVNDTLTEAERADQAEATEAAEKQAAVDYRAARMAQFQTMLAASGGDPGAVQFTTTV